MSSSRFAGGRASEASTITRAERAGAAARESACRGVRRGEAPRTMKINAESRT
jgi:hypothetical protein